MKLIIIFIICFGLGFFNKASKIKKENEEHELARLKAEKDVLYLHAMNCKLRAAKYKYCLDKSVDENLSTKERLLYSAKVCRLAGVPANEILCTKEDIDKYFLG